MREGLEDNMLVRAGDESEDLKELSGVVNADDVELECAVVDVSFARDVDVEANIDICVLVDELVTLLGR